MLTSMLPPCAGAPAGAPDVLICGAHAHSPAVRAAVRRRRYGWSTPNTTQRVCVSDSAPFFRPFCGTEVQRSMLELSSLAQWSLAGRWRACMVGKCHPTLQHTDSGAARCAAASVKQWPAAKFLSGALCLLTRVQGGHLVPPGDLPLYTESQVSTSLKNEVLTKLSSI